MTNPAEIVRKIGVTIVLVFSFLLPLWFLPITSEFYDFNKQVLLFVVTLLLLLTIVSKWIIDKKVRVTNSPLNLPSLLIVVSLLVSTIAKSPNRMEALLDPMQTGTFIAGILLFWAICNIVVHKKELIYLIGSLLSSAFILSIVSILWSSGVILKLLPQSLNYMNSIVWSPTGSSLTTLVYLGITLVMSTIIVLRTKPNSLLGAALSFTIFSHIVALGVVGYQLFAPQSPYKPAFLAYSHGWAIALESLKTSPVLGSGPGTFLADFTQFRPINFNAESNWLVRFTSSSNQYLQVLTISGLFGLVAYLFWILKANQLVIRSIHMKESYVGIFGGSLVVLLVVQLIIPLSVPLLSLMFILAAGLITTLKQAGSTLAQEADLDIIAASNSVRFPVLPWVIFVPSAILIVTGLVLLSRTYWAEVLFQKSLVAAASNDGKTTYNSLIEAIQTNPFRDTYRVAYSQTNMLLANSLASNKDLTDQDRATITQLVQQGLREAKNAVALNSTKVTNIENLASIYRNLLNFAEGADAWTIASYQQAIVLDPVNPNLRLALGGVYFAQKNFDDAVNQFQNAVNLKPDLANAHYNLAIALREKGQYERALASMEQVLALVDKSSEDFKKASGEADELRKKITPKEDTKKSTKPSQLTTPETTLPKPVINPPLPAAAIAPDASPSATPTPTPAPSPLP